VGSRKQKLTVTVDVLLVDNRNRPSTLVEGG